jgi:hypothetical protein
MRPVAVARIVEQQADGPVRAFQSFECGAELARHFIDVVEEVGRCIVFGVHCPDR